MTADLTPVTRGCSLYVYGCTLGEQAGQPSVRYCTTKCGRRVVGECRGETLTASSPPAVEAEPWPPPGMVALSLGGCRVLDGLSYEARKQILLPPPPDGRPRVTRFGRTYVLLPFDVYAGLVESSMR